MSDHDRPLGFGISLRPSPQAPLVFTRHQALPVEATVWPPAQTQRTPSHLHLSTSYDSWTVGHPKSTHDLLEYDPFPNPDAFSNFQRCRRSCHPESEPYGPGSLAPPPRTHTTALPAIPGQSRHLRPDAHTSTWCKLAPGEREVLAQLDLRRLRTTSSSLKGPRVPTDPQRKEPEPVLCGCPLRGQPPCSCPAVFPQRNSSSVAHSRNLMYQWPPGHPLVPAFRCHEPGPHTPFPFAAASAAAADLPLHSSFPPELVFDSKQSPVWTMDWTPRSQRRTSGTQRPESG